MITYHCDRCGKEIVNGAIYRVAITVESVGTPNMIEAMEVMFEGRDNRGQMLLQRL